MRSYVNARCLLIPGDVVIASERRKRLHSAKREDADECGELQLFFFLPDNALLMCLDGRRGCGVSGV